MNPRPEEPLEERPGPDPDARLMLAFQRGDRRAFDQLVERYANALVNYFYFQSRDQDLAEDCAQDVWAKLFRARDQYEPRALFRTWLFRVARNHWIDTLRSLGRRPPPLSLSLGEGEEGSSSLAERLAALPGGGIESLERRELAERLGAALGRLTEEMREVFLLGEIEELPYAEIARILGIPVGTVKSRMYHAVRRLRAWLGQDLKP